MLLAFRNLLIDVIPKVVLLRQDFDDLLAKLGHADVLLDLPANATYRQAATAVVTRADAQGWVAALHGELLKLSPHREDLKTIQTALDADALVPTDKEPINEVLVEGYRPFVNRRKLRNALLQLVDPAGESVLLMDGAKETGKTFSYYLLYHAASRHGFLVHKFDLSKAPTLVELTEEMLLRLLGVVPPLPEQGFSTGERYTDKLAGQIAAVIKAEQTRRFFIFDNFPTNVTVPPETLGLISRLAVYSDEELRGVLRVVLVRFPGVLSNDVLDVAAEEIVQPFTPTDMVETMQKIADARKWDITEAVLKNKIDQFEAQGPRTLRDRFRFLRTMILELTAAAKALDEAQP